MYAKLFASLYQGTLRGKSHEILVFTNLLATADAEGYVDKHFRAIAEEVGLSIEEVKSAISNLESPDMESRSPEYNGARIVRIDDHRVWGWRIVNYLKYRRIKNQEDRREQNRINKAKEREKRLMTVSSVSNVSLGQPQSAHAEAEGDAEAEGEEAHSRFSERPSWREFWEYCLSVHCGLPVEWYAKDKYEAANVKGWKNMADWRAYARRCKNWWDNDGRPQVPHPQNKTSRPKPIAP